MMPRRIAAKQVILPDGTINTNHVIELFGSRLVNHYPLEGEIEMTEWLGGTIVFKEQKPYHITTHADGTQHIQPLSQ